MSQLTTISASPQIQETILHCSHMRLSTRPLFRSFISDGLLTLLKQKRCRLQNFTHDFWGNFLVGSVTLFYYQIILLYQERIQINFSKVQSFAKTSQVRPQKKIQEKFPNNPVFFLRAYLINYVLITSNVQMPNLTNIYCTFLRGKRSYFKGKPSSTKSDV